MPVGKTLATFDFEAVPMVSKAQVTALAAGDTWLENGANVLLFGPPGAGKSHLAAAIGLALVEHHRLDTLFGVSSGIVRNIGLLSIQIDDTVGYANGSGGDGALAGVNYGTINNVFATGNPKAGVPVGSPFDGTTYPALTAAVSGTGNIGGLVGGNAGLIVNFHAAVSVYSATEYVGGLVGWNVGGSSCCGFSFGVILNSYATGNVSAGDHSFADGGWVGAWAIGGFVGINIGGTISNSWSSGNIYTLNATDIGGIAGENYSAARSTSVLNNVSSSGTITIGWDAYQRYGTSAGGLVVANSGNINGGYTSSNIVVNALYYAPYGFSLLFQSVGAGFGDQMGNANAVTATGTVTYNGQLQNVYTGGWDFGGTTNQIYTPGVPGVPPQQIGTLNRQLGAVQLANNAVQGPAAAKAAYLAAQAALLAREQQGANAANVASTATNAAAASAAGKAGSLDSVTAALDANFKSIETSVQADDRRIRRGVVTTAATTAGGARCPSFRSTIRSIEINGRRINVPENAPNQNPR